MGFFVYVFYRGRSMEPKDEEKVKKNFNSKTSYTLLEMFKLVRQEDKELEWIVNNVWNKLLEKWNMSPNRSKCDITKKNCLSDKGGNLHTEGSIGMHKYVICLL